MNSFPDFTTCLVLSLIFSRFCSFVIFNATSTWKSHDFPKRQIDLLLELIKEDSIGSFSALCSDFFVIPNAVRFEFLKFGSLLKNSVSVGFAPGHPPSI